MAAELANLTSRSRRQNVSLVGMIVGGFLFLVAPLAGLLLTVYGSMGSFAAVEGNAIPPEHKAKVLADGLSLSMTAGVIGTGASVLGLVILIASLVVFLSSTRRAQPNA